MSFDEYESEKILKYKINISLCVNDYMITLGLFKRLWNHFQVRRQRQFMLLQVLIVISSFTEVVNIGMVIPFIGVLTAPEIVYEYQFVQIVSKLLNITSPDQLILPIMVLFILVITISVSIRLLLLYVTSRLSEVIGADLSINIYRRTLYQKYSTHISRNSSEVIDGVIRKTSAVTGGIVASVLQFINSTFLIVSIVGVLVFIDTYMALTTIICFSFFYWLVIRFTRERLHQNSKIIAHQSIQMIKSLQEGLGGIRDVLLDGSQEFYSKLYRNADLPLRRAATNNAFISASPRYIIEMVGMIIIVAVAYSMMQRDSDTETIIPMLGALALGAQRLLPALQQAYSSYASIKSNYVSFIDVLDLLDQPLPSHINNNTIVPPLEFSKEVGLNNIEFKYTDNGSLVLKNIKLKIKKGTSIGFMGVTGSGKSTLLDIVMGLLSPTKGNLTVDDQTINEENVGSWQVHIAHVPQNIYLSDCSIEENIALGIPKEKINRQQVSLAAKRAQIDNIVEEWPNKYQTVIGERGVRLSGGQRQRIGIARALYNHADVLIFDEATSALDNDTESAVMKAISGLGSDLTVLIIAHRLTTLKNCDTVVELKNGCIVRTGEYKDMV